MKEINYINPRVDVAFKKIFGVEENKDLLISLINSIVFERDQVDKIELLNPYNEKNFIDDKLSIVDIKARNKNDGTYFLIEMQIVDEIDYNKRSLYSWARVYSNQIQQGDSYDKLKKTIAIHILNFTFIEYADEDLGDAGNLKSQYVNKYNHCFTLQDKETKKEIFPDLEIHTIELKKFELNKDEPVESALSKVKSMLEAWLVVLTKYSLLDRKKLPKQMNKPEIKKALKVMNEMTFSALEREVYNSHIDYWRMMESADRKIRHDIKQEGIKEGLEKGLIEGEKKATEKIAIKMLKQNVEFDMIEQFTQLPIDEIKKLKEQLKK